MRLNRSAGRVSEGLLCEGVTMLIEELAVLAVAFALDAALGDPPSKLHPVVWIGYVISQLKKLNRGSKVCRFSTGVVLAVAITLLSSLPVYFMLNFAHDVSPLAFIVSAGLILKFSFAFRSLVDYTRPIAERLMGGDIDGARSLIPYIARRDPAKLSEEHIISAAVESIAESTVDGITSPLLYFAIFGVPGAMAYRTVNTLDSMVGYKTRELKHFGWFSARLDTLLNFIPSRLTALLIALSAWLLKMNGRGSIQMAFRDHGKTESLNAGWPMSAMAGALGVRLVKPGFYELGDPVRGLQPEHIIQAIKIMKLTTALFISLVCIPFLTFRCLLSCMLYGMLGW